MFSLRYGVRRAAAVTVASALAATVFVGCSNQNESLAESVSTAEVTTADSTSEAATTVSTAEAAEDNIPDEINSGITASDSVGTGDGTTDDIAVSITDNRDILQSDNDARDEIDRIAEEQQRKDEEIAENTAATPEEHEQHMKDKQDRQDMADDTDAYTTDDIPLTTEGGLTEPAKPTKNYKLPDGAQLEFSGNASTAEITTLPEGCYWTPYAVYGAENAFTDPAGNIWVNRDPESLPFERRGMDNGYYDARGEYHFSQEEIDRANAIFEADREIAEHGPFVDGTSNMTTQEADSLWALLGE